MYVLDVEASGLSDHSYPIEIAWQHRFNPTLRDAFLIRPTTGWTHWDLYAEQYVHRISREQLQVEGIDAVSASQRLNEQLAGQVVYSDHADKDRFWISRLFDAANLAPQFEIRSVYSLLPPEKEMSFSMKLGSSPTEHRALADVRAIINILNFYAPADAGQSRE